MTIEHSIAGQMGETPVLNVSIEGHINKIAYSDVLLCYYCPQYGKRSEENIHC